jgi:murein DD-endopeptidase MepM/ murein hydrolase activator NlpD
MRYEGRITWRRAFAAAALLELGVMIGVATWLAVTRQALVLSVQPRAVVAAVKEEAPGALRVPVAGVRRAELRDSYGAGRSGGRKHLGIDIMAPQGTAVLAATDGVIVKRDSSALGGISLYQRGLDGTTLYYYAHLSRYQPGLKEGDLVRGGDVIAYVGMTGNAPVPHLHFGVYTVTDPNRWWHGRDLNPYELLREKVR